MKFLAKAAGSGGATEDWQVNFVKPLVLDKCNGMGVPIICTRLPPSTLVGIAPACCFGSFLDGCPVQRCAGRGWKHEIMQAPRCCQRAVLLKRAWAAPVRRGTPGFERRSL